MPLARNVFLATSNGHAAPWAPDCSCVLMTGIRIAAAPYSQAKVEEYMCVYAALHKVEECLLQSGKAARARGGASQG